jgi:uncharacterized protein (TIGR02996 family)
MTGEQSFLAEIAAHPHDDTTRLVYADWLDEQDDARGRYLRLEVELAGLAEGSERYAALEEELQTLRLDIDPEWLALVGKRYDLLLYSYRPDQKIQTIKTIRQLTGLGLKEAKDISEAPLPVTILASVLRVDAERGRELLCYASGQQVAEARLRVAAQDRRSTTASAVCELVLCSYPPEHKIALIKAIRQLTGLGLVEAKHLSERPLPVVLSAGLEARQAQQGASLFRGVAEVQIRTR